MSIGRTLVLLGAVLVAVGFAVSFAPHIPWLGWLGRLPGDLRIERGGFRLYLPITTSVLVSVVLSLLLSLISRLR